MKPHTGRGFTRRVIGHQMGGILCADTFSQRIPHNSFLTARAISSVDPNDIRKLTIATSQKASVFTSIPLIEYFGTNTPLPVYFVAPSRKQTNIQTMCGSFLDHEIHPRKIGFIRPGRIVVEQRKIPVAIRSVQSVQFGKDTRLNHCKTLCLPICEVIFHLRRIQSVKKLPGRISEIRERGPVLMNQESSVV